MEATKIELVLHFEQPAPIQDIIALPNPIVTSPKNGTDERSIKRDPK